MEGEKVKDCSKYLNCGKIDCKFKHSSKRVVLEILAAKQCSDYENCSYADCKYTHTFGWDAYQNALKLKEIKCKNFDNCAKNFCYYSHAEQIEKAIKYKSSGISQATLSATLQFFCSLSYFLSFIVPMAFDISIVKEYRHDDYGQKVEKNLKNSGVIIFANLHQAMIFKCSFEQTSRIRCQFFVNGKMKRVPKNPVQMSIKKFVEPVNRKRGTLKIPPFIWSDFIYSMRKSYSGKNIIICGSNYNEILPKDFQIIKKNILLTANFKSKLGQSLNNANGITYVSYGGIEEVKKIY